jgi:hypothetical protein
MKREVVVLVCDLCQREGDGVASHEVALDRKAVVVETCERCQAKAEKALGPLLEAGRRAKRPKA